MRHQIQVEMRFQGDLVVWRSGSLRSTAVTSLAAALVCFEDTHLAAASSPEPRPRWGSSASG